MPSPPAVYVGPTLPHIQVEETLSGCHVRGPVRRGDLYRDREAGVSVFLILDGVFYQNTAVSPREVLDVIADGALVVGASSLGALRAAECWPAGMRGVGAIYRLFRRGWLISDDEVALTFTPGPEYEPLTVPLINVRHALRCAVREGLLESGLAKRILCAAEETFYADRVWPEILEKAGIRNGGERKDLESLLSIHDLKRDDALLALRQVSRWLRADPGLACRARRWVGPFEPLDQTRERPQDALAGESVDDVRRQLARWHLLSGRCMRYLLAVAAANPESELGRRLERKHAQMPALATLLVPPRIDGTRTLGLAEREALARPVGVRLVLTELWAAAVAEEEAFAERLWAELTVSRELDAEVFRWRALREGSRQARKLGLVARRRDRWLAEIEIAYGHELRSWAEVERAFSTGPLPWPEWEAYRDQLALAKRFRELLFNPVPGSSR